eukprot:ANDGO_04109.mRNA.1 hypothetical protein
MDFAIAIAVCSAVAVFLTPFQKHLSKYRYAKYDNPLLVVEYLRRIDPPAVEAAASGISSRHALEVSRSSS